MATVEIFLNQGQNLIAEPIDVVGDPIIIEGTCKVDISGDLDGATMKTQYLDATQTWVDVDGAVWDGKDIPPPVLPATSYPNLDNHQIRFELLGVGAATSISVTLTYDPSREVYIKHAAYARALLKKEKIEHERES